MPNARNLDAVRRFRWSTRYLNRFLRHARAGVPRTSVACRTTAGVPDTSDEGGGSKHKGETRRYVRHTLRGICFTAPIAVISFEQGKGHRRERDRLLQEAQ